MNNGSYMKCWAKLLAIGMVHKAGCCGCSHIWHRIASYTLVFRSLSSVGTGLALLSQGSRRPCIVHPD